MSELLNEIKKDISDLKRQIIEIGPNKLSADDTTRLNEKLSSALTEIDKILTNKKAKLPQAKDKFLEARARGHPLYADLLYSARARLTTKSSKWACLSAIKPIFP